MPSVINFIREHHIEMKFLENRTLAQMGGRCTLLKVLCMRETFRILFSVAQHLSSALDGLAFEVSRSYTIRHTHTHTVGLL
jgi:hypothetical protein